MRKFSVIFFRIPLTRRTFRNTASLAVLCLASGTGGAFSGMGTVEIKLLANGQPCFSLPAKDVKRDPAARVGALAVTDLSQSSPTEVWRMAYAPMQGAPLSAVGCFAYGDTPETATSAPAGALQEGRPYSISIRVRPSERNDPTFGYSATFCLIGQGAERRVTVIGSADRFRATGRCE